MLANNILQGIPTTLDVKGLELNISLAGVSSQCIQQLPPCSSDSLASRTSKRDVTDRHALQGVADICIQHPCPGSIDTSKPYALCRRPAGVAGGAGHQGLGPVPEPWGGLGGVPLPAVPPACCTAPEQPRQLQQDQGPHDYWHHRPVPCQLVCSSHRTGKCIGSRLAFLTALLSCNATVIITLPYPANARNTHMSCVSKAALISTHACPKGLLIADTCACL